MRRQRANEPAQHAAFGIVDAMLERRAGPRGNPGRVADYERGAPIGKQIGLHEIDLAGEPETLDVLPRASQRAWISVGRDNARDATLRQNCGQHAGASADVEGNAWGCSCRRGNSGGGNY